MTDYIIREMIAEDATSVLDIFAQGIRTKNATFETKVPTWEQWNAGFFSFSRLVIEQNERVLAWAGIKPISSRDCFNGVGEVSIYLDQLIFGKGLGKFLLEKLVYSTEENGIWTLQSSIFPENKASLNIHFRCGFREIGYREKIASMDGKWRDVVLLERRSQVVHPF